jgi:hypothetical protein
MFSRHHGRGHTHKKREHRKQKISIAERKIRKARKDFKKTFPVLCIVKNIYQHAVSITKKKCEV